MTYLSPHYASTPSTALEMRVYQHSAHSSSYSSAQSSLPAMVYNLEEEVGYSASASLIPSSLAAMPTIEEAVKPNSLNSPYAAQSSDQSYLMPHSTSYFSPEAFLKHGRPLTQWITDNEEIIQLVEEVFEKVTGNRLPQDISIAVVPEQDLQVKQQALGGRAGPGLQGFSLNRHGFSASEIFVKQNELDKLLLTIGHEIGHVLSFSLSDQLAEECKAFAFELAWMETIIEHNIADLSVSLNLTPLQPANNGLHDVAWQWIQHWKKEGKTGKDIFRQLIKNELRPGEV